jgi:hypothetical protein
MVRPRSPSRLTSTTLTMPIAIAALAVGGLVGAAVNNQNKDSQKGAPSITEANKDGVLADMRTLVNRIQVNTAAEAGGVYTDPVSGETFDFRGKFDPIRFAKDHPTALKEYVDEQAKGELQGWTEEQFAKAFLGDNQAELDKYRTGSPAYRNQTTIDTAKQMAGAADDINSASMRAQAKTQLELLPEFNALNLKAQEDALNQYIGMMPKFGDAQRTQDAATFRQNVSLGNEALQNNVDQQAKHLPGINTLSLDMQQQAFNRTQTANETSFQKNLDQADTAAARAVALQQKNLPGLNDLNIRLQTDSYKGADAAGRAVNPNLYGLRDDFATQLREEFASGADLTPAQQRKVQQRIRGSQAARGNILGDGAAFDEAIAESDYAQDMIDKRRGAALGLINSRDLAPNFSSVGVLNPTQVVAPNQGTANFTATTAVNPMMPNFGTPSAPAMTPTTVGVPTSSTASTIKPGNPLSIMDPNAGQSGQNYALNAWNSQQNRVANAPNPWVTGLGAAAKTYGAFGGGG